MKYHIAAFFLGFLLDLILGDPHFLPHPVRLIGKLIINTEKRLRMYKGENSAKTELFCGSILVLIVSVTVTAVSACILFLSYHIHPYAGMAIETVMTYQLLAAKCLKDESMKVFDCLQDNDLAKVRIALSMIVGRDTQCLDVEGITKAAIETVAENTSDGVIAPMIFTAIGTPILGFFYKAVNTMDSMVGYKNDKYLYFGRVAAKLDDIVNFIPARISASLMILAALILGIFDKKFSAEQALKIYARDRKNHASPNSAQTEAVCAGALKIRLAGDAVYFGKTVKKPYIGDALRSVECEDIKRANKLMYMTAWLGWAACLAVMIWGIL